MECPTDGDWGSLRWRRRPKPLQFVNPERRTTPSNANQLACALVMKSTAQMNRTKTHTVVSMTPVMCKDQDYQFIRCKSTGRFQLQQFDDCDGHPNCTVGSDENRLLVFHDLLISRLNFVELTWTSIEFHGGARILQPTWWRSHQVKCQVQEQKFRYSLK